MCFHYQLSISEHVREAPSQNQPLPRACVSNSPKMSSQKQPEQLEAASLPMSYQRYMNGLVVSVPQE